VACTHEPSTERDAQLDAFAEHCRKKWREAMTFSDRALILEFMQWLVTDGQELLRGLRPQAVVAKEGEVWQSPYGPVKVKIERMLD
jgi:hypothetical protein